MQIHYHSKGLLQALNQLPQSTRVLVPTMGNLHSGHLSLVEEARRQGDAVIVSIFVNPMQFGSHEDIDAYPRTMDSDIEKLRVSGCDHLFAPGTADIYPEGLTAQTVVHVPGLSSRHCGISRPGHFDGVTTIVSKLFNMTRPDKAVFGLKDYQQFMLINKLISDLCYPIELVGVETCREASGLAMSSRNGYLDPAQRETAAGLYRELLQAAAALKNGQDIATIENQAQARLVENGLRPDYFTVCHAQTLEPATAEDRDLVILAAVYLGRTRLIDNIRVSLNT
ncbi:MAG: pantoate--beta-alanine ligase [Pseudomonadales bacterium]|nr:pantoate--beta-alanine ligase [Pseudomonadales bacterium]